MPTTIKFENWDGVTPIALPAGWVEPSDFAQMGTSASDSYSAPNSLDYLGTYHLGLQENWNVADTFNGNVQVSSYIKFDAAPSSQMNANIVARYGPSATTPTTSASCYLLDMILNGGGNTGLILFRRVSGTDTVISGPSFPSALTYGIWYYAQLITQDTNISVRIQRQDTSQWLNSSGTWVTDGTGQTFCMAVTDTQVTGSGYAGVGFYAPNVTGTAMRQDNFLFEGLGSGGASPNPLASGDASVSITSATSLTVSATKAIYGTAPYSYQYQSSPDGTTWTNIGTAQTGLASSVDPSPYTNTGITTGLIKYYRCKQTDSAGTPAIVYTPVVSAAPRASSAAYYISSAGSDSNTGLSSSSPWHTLAHVSAWGAMPGDQFLFNGGDSFSGNILFTGVVGTYAAPLTLTTYGTGKATISCGNIYGIRTVNCSGIVIGNLTIVGSGVNSNGTSSSTNAGVEIINAKNTGNLAQVYLDKLDVSGCYSGIEVRGSAPGVNGTGSGFVDIKITNCVCHEILYAGIFVRTLPLLDSTGASFRWSDYSLPNNLGSSSNNYSIFAGHPSQYVYVANCEVYHSYGDPARTDSIHSGDGIMVKSAQDCLVERCVVHDGGQHGFGPAGNWMQEVTRGTIRFCETYNFHTSSPGTDGDGFDFDGGCVDCVMEFCYSHNCDGAGYLCGPYPGGSSPLRCIIRYCVSENDGRQGLPSILPYQNADLTIHNCVVYTTPPLAGSGTTSCLGDGGVSNIKVWNNLFLSRGGVKLINGTFTGGSFVGNLYWDYGDDLFIAVGGNNYTSFSSFVTAGFEQLNGNTVGVYADPLLSNPGAGTAMLPTQQTTQLTSYDPSPSSPTVGAGVDIKTFFGVDAGQIDFHGLPNRFPGYDIGPVKYGVGTKNVGGFFLF